MERGAADESDDDRLMATLAAAAGLVPPAHLKQPLYDEMRELRTLAAVLREMPLDDVESASVFTVPVT